MKIGAKIDSPLNKWQSEIVQILLIWLLGGAFQEVVVERGFLDWESIKLRHILMSGSFWVMLWKGSEYQVLLLDRLGLTWERHGAMRAVASLVLTTLYVILVVTLIYTFYYVISGQMTFADLLPQLTLGIFWPSLIITIAVSGIMHGRAFWIEWLKESKEKENYRIESANFKFQALKNQVNPHFLFNSLNVLSSLVYDDQKKAVEFIRKLSEVYRYVLDRQDEELVTVEEELAFIESFVFLQKIRFSESLRVNIKGEAKGSIPPIALQILIENAIKHNIVSESKPLEILIIFENNSAIVQNNIQEKLTKDSTGIGLNNLISRYEYLTDRKVEIENADGQFRVVLPLLTVKS
ncbi:MAG: histidine kinase [Cyclobacteriaceae bacterium]